MKYGFISAGGSSWAIKPLSQLEPGNRIWVNVPGRGYVGVGEVTDTVVRFDEFDVENNGDRTAITELPVEAPRTPAEGKVRRMC